jgi:hypothetical protein
MLEKPIPERHRHVTTVLEIFACWGIGSIAVGLWIGPMLRLATAEQPVFPNGIVSGKSHRFP